MIDPYQAQRERHLPDYMKSPDTREYERQELKKQDDAAWDRHREAMSAPAPGQLPSAHGTDYSRPSAPMDMGSMATAGAGLCAVLVVAYGWLGLHWGIGQLVVYGAIAAVVGAVGGVALYVAIKVLVVVLRIAVVMAVIGILLHFLGVIDFMAVLKSLGRQLGLV